MTYGYSKDIPGNDTELIAALVVFQKAPPEVLEDLGLTKWECAFIGQLPEIWKHHGSITWKQRAHANRLVLKLHDRLQRRADIAALLKRKD